MMIQINICTRGTDNGDMAFVSHLSGIWKMLAVCGEKALSPGKRCQIFFWNPLMLQCCTLASVISHKASLILHQEQLRGLWSEIKRCTIHFLCITSLIIHLNCSETLSRAKCRARCWLEMCRHVHVKGCAWESTKETVCVCVSIRSHRVQCYEGRSGLVTERPNVTQLVREVFSPHQTILYRILFSTADIFYLRSDTKVGFISFIVMNKIWTMLELRDYAWQ